jgi:tRNA 2-thiouridine synthesizing protein E
MPLEIVGKTVPVDDEGYVIDPADWDEQVAEALARQERIVLSGEHWPVIRFMREYYE